MYRHIRGVPFFLRPKVFYFLKQHAAAVIGNKMVVVGGESGDQLLDDVQVVECSIICKTRCLLQYIF